MTSNTFDASESTNRASRIATGRRFLDQDFKDNEKALRHQFLPCFRTFEKADELLNLANAWSEDGAFTEAAQECLQTKLQEICSLNEERMTFLQIAKSDGEYDRC